MMRNKISILSTLLMICYNNVHSMSITITNPANASTVTSTPISITGTSSSPSTLVKLTLNGTIIATTTTNGLGNWNFTLPSLFNGSYSLTAELLDINYEVLASDTNIFTMDQYTIVITSPIDNEIVFLSPAHINGNTSLSSGFIRILLDGSLVATTTADINGVWDTTYSFTTNGSHTLTAQLIVSNTPVVDAVVSVTAQVPVINSGNTITSIGGGSGTDGQVLIAATLGSAAFATLTSSNNSISFTPGPNSLDLTTSSSAANTFVTDNGTANPVNGVLNIFGTANVHTSGSGMTVTITLDGSPTFTGTITTNNLVVTGTTKLSSLSAGVVVSDSFGYISSEPTINHAVQVGDAVGQLQSLALGTNGQVLIGGTSVNPAFANLTSSNNSILFTTGVNSLDLVTSSSAAFAFPTDNGTATPLNGNLNVLGGSNIHTSGSGNTISIFLDGSPTVTGTVTAGNFSTTGTVTTGNLVVTGTTRLQTLGAGVVVSDSFGYISSEPTINHAVQVGDAVGQLQSLALGTNGQVIIGGTGINPAFANLTSANGTIEFTTGPNTLDLRTSGSAARSFVTDNGTAIPSNGVLNIFGTANVHTSGSGMTVTVTLDGSPTFTGTITTNNLIVTGTTKLSSLGAGVVVSDSFGYISSRATTNHAVQVGNGVGQLQSLGLGTNGQVLIAGTGIDPAFATLTSSNGTISYSRGPNSLDLITSSSFITDSGTATPVNGILNILGTANVHTSGSGLTVTVTLDGSPTFTGTVTTNNLIVTTTLTVNGNIVLPAATAGQSTATSRGLLELGGANTNGTNINMFEVATRNMFAGNYTTVPNVSGTDNIAFGTSTNSTLTTANNTIAIGNSTTATATDSLAVGDSATASAARSIALGSRDSTSSGAGPTASTNTNTIAIGSANSTRTGPVASGQSAIAIGGADTASTLNGASATGARSIALGVNANSSAAGTITIGSSSGSAGGTGPVANNTGAIAIGSANDANASATASAISTIAIGASSTTSGGIGPVASNTSSIAIGGSGSLAPGAAASGLATIAIGGVDTATTFSGASATGSRSIAIGGGAISPGQGTISIGAAGGTTGGNGPTTSADGDIAIGSAQISNSGPIATGGGAIAIGSAEAPVGTRAGAAATATRAIAIGSGSSASTNSLAIGTSAVASANRTIALGFTAAASGANSYAIGESTSSSGARSAAIGFGATTAQDDAIVLGNSATPAVRVGIGTNTPSAKIDVVTTTTDPLRLSGNLASSLNDFVVSINATGFVKTSNVPINALTNGNVVRVDQVFGNNVTGARNGPPCATITNALSKAQSGDTVWVFPGTYAESFTIPSGVTVRGLSQTGVVISTTVGVATDLVTMGTSSALMDVTLTLNSTAHVQLRGIVFPSTTTATARVARVSLTVDNSGAGAGASNVYGVNSTGTGTPAFSFINLLDSTIVVASAGTGAKRGILVDAANSFNVRECTIAVTNATGTGSAIGIETNNASAICRVNNSSTSGSGNASSADISKTLGTLIITATDLANSNANGLSFTTDVEPSTVLWSFNGNAPGAGTYFLAFGDATPTANAIAMRINQPTIIQNLSIRSRIGPSAGTTHTFTVFRNGVATTISAVLSTGSPSTATDTTDAISFATGDTLSLQYVRVGGGTNPADLVATVDMY